MERRIKVASEEGKEQEEEREAKDCKFSKFLAFRTGLARDKVTPLDCSSKL